MAIFNYCVLTASDRRQADVFTRLLERRKTHGLYPREVDFRVYADPEGGRVGSGGGTLWALLCLLKGLRIDAADGKAVAGFFAENRILIIHAGGESRRLPCYAAEGKLFAPVPAPSSSTAAPVVLDMELDLFFRYPWRQGETVVASGDVIISFDTSALSLPDGEVCGFAKPAALSQGARHGVFRFDVFREQVLDYFQKQPASFLREHALLEGTDECGLDIGVISLGPAFLSALIGLLGGKVAGGGGTVGSLLAAGAFRFDLYLEMLTACLPGLSLDGYLDRVSGGSALSADALSSLYETFHPFPLKGVLTTSTQFLHFGSLPEFPEACAAMTRSMMLPFYGRPGEELVPSVSDSRIMFNSHAVRIDGGPAGFVYAENCADVACTAYGGNLFLNLSGFKPGYAVAEGVCVDYRMLPSGEHVYLAYGANDNYKKDTSENLALCGAPLLQWLAERGLDEGDIWDKPEDRGDILKANLYPLGASVDFLEGYWQKPSDPAVWKRTFLSGKRYSIARVNAESDPLARAESREAVRKRELGEAILVGRGFRSVNRADFAGLFTEVDYPRLRELYARTDDPLLKAYRRALVSSVCGIEEDAYYHISFVRGDETGRPLQRAVKKDQIVWSRCPVRIDLAGGWSDTPPYTNREGGIVTNVALDLNGQPPIQVFVRPTEELRIRIHSIDLGVTETLSTDRELLDFRNPVSPFALPKAALCLLGIARENAGGEGGGGAAEGGTLTKALGAMGCGLEVTLLCAVPKGSGLGTSSILGGAILAALSRFFGRPMTDNDLFLHVLEMEQMLTTGGGWQDQIGGLVGGVKYIETKPGLKPSPVIHQLDTYLFENRDSLSRMTLYYTGITRLAKNILQEVVASSNGMTPAYLYTLRSLKILAQEARDALSLRNLTALAHVLDGSWKANKLIHPSTTNDEVETLLAALKACYTGMKLFGAGGGGFALFISPDERNAETLRGVIRTRFEGERSRMVDFSLNRQGLVTTVS